MELGEFLGKVAAETPLGLLIVYMLWRLERSLGTLHGDVIAVIKKLAGLNGDVDEKISNL